MKMNEGTLLNYFAGKLSEEDRVKVEMWINESPDNYKIAKDIHSIYFATEAWTVMNNTNTVNALRLVNKKIRKKKSKLFLHWFQRVAAILFIPLLILVIYRTSQSYENINYIEVHATSGTISNVKLPDGSDVWLNSGSILQYPSTFSGKSREIFLNGEGYFNITKNEAQPFIVKTTSDLQIEVLGTEFNLDAYEKNTVIVTSLVEGSIRLSYEYQGREKHLIMQPDQQIVYNKQTHIPSEYSTYIPKDIAWKEGKIILRDTPLEEVVWILEKRFNVEFSITNEKLKENSFTGTFRHQDLTQILEHLKISSKINYQFEENISADNETVISRIILF